MRICQVCDGEGQNDCLRCDGDGFVEAVTDRVDTYPECSVCEGFGWLTCEECEGNGIYLPEEPDEGEATYKEHQYT